MTTCSRNANKVPLCACVRQPESRAQHYNADGELSVRRGRLMLVHGDRGANGKLSQETAEVTTGAPLISLQPYRALCRVSPVTL